MTIQSVTYIGETYIRLNLTFPARIDSTYLLSSNYVISVMSGSSGNPVVVTRVIRPQGDGVVASYVYLETSRHSVGTDYQVNYTTLNNSGGIVVPPTIDPIPYASRITKTVQVLKSLPSYLDKRVDALVRNLVTAISMQDDIIGGSRHDLFPSESTVIIDSNSAILAENGNILNTENDNVLIIE